MPARHRGKYPYSVAHEEKDTEFRVYDDDDEEDDDEESVSCYSWCGNPDYPKCMDSCKMWDD